MVKYLSLYLLVINIAAIAAFFYDKQMARAGKRRVPERTLFWLAGLGGSVGAWLGMQLFHHKTRHISFVAGIPAIFAMQAAAAGAVWYFFLR